MNALRTGIFDVAAGIYDWLTRHEVWRDHCRQLVAHFPPRGVGRSIRVLDLGIGPGVSGLAVLDRRPEAEVVGIDLARKMLRRASRHAATEGRRLALVRADGAALPFDRRTFDVVMAHSFLYIVPDRERVIAEIARVLRPGGRCVLMEPQESPPPSAWRRLRGPLRFYLSMIAWRVYSRGPGRFTPESLETQLSAALEDVHVEPTLAGLGLLATATAPQKQALDNPPPPK